MKPSDSTERPRARPVAVPKEPEPEPAPALPRNLRGARRREQDDDRGPPPRGRGAGRALFITFGIIIALCVGLPMAMFYFLFAGGGGSGGASFKSAGGSDGPNADPGERKVERVLEQKHFHPSRTVELVFSPDGRELAAVTEDGYVEVFRGVSEPGLEPTPFMGFQAETRLPGHRPAFAPDSARLATADPDAKGKGVGHSVYLFRPRKASADEFTGLDDRPAKIAFSPDGQWLVAGGAGKGWVKVWDTAKQGAKLLLLSEGGSEATHVQDGMEAGITVVAFAPGGKRLLTAGGSDLKLWKTERWPDSIGFERSLTHSSRITVAAFDPRSRWVGAGGSDGVTRVWEIDKPEGKPFEQSKTNQVAIKQLAFSTFRHVAALDGAGVGYLWEARNPARLTPIDWHTGRVNAIAFNPEGSLFATAGDDNTVRLWDQFWGKPHEAKVTGHAAAVTAIAFSPDGNRLAVADASGTVIIWQVPNPKKKLPD